jgi:ribonuclease P protein component
MNKSFSYDKSHRLTKRSDIDAVYKKGRVLRSSFYTAYYLESEISRLGISVPARYGNAVLRNREKRIIREVFRKLINDFESSIDIMIALRRKSRDIPSKIADLASLFKYLGRAKC